VKKLIDSFLSFLSAKIAVPAEQDEWTVNVVKFQQVTDYKFKNTSILKAALTHDSFFHKFRKETSKAASPSERMEFLGDSILGLVVAEHLFLYFPDDAEGQLAKKKSKIVSEKYLTLKAHAISLGQYIIMAEEEDKSGGRNRNSILSDAMESLICAIYMDGGITQARRFIKNFILNDFKDFLNIDELINYKSKLQEYSQSKYHVPPVYHVLREDGPEHLKEFYVNVLINNQEMGRGLGKSKKEAQQAAAKNACEKLKF